MLRRAVLQASGGIVRVLATEAPVQKGRAQANKDCLLIDDDSRDDLLAVITAVEESGFTVRHVRRQVELAEELERYKQTNTRPAFLAIDVFLPWYNLGLLDKHEVTIDDSDTAGITLYERALMETSSGVSECPVFFISNHQNIAVLAAHRLRVQLGKKCIFASKPDFVKNAASQLRSLISGEDAPSAEKFSNEDYELLWTGMCDYYALKEHERFAALGLETDANIDFLTLIAGSKDARERINILVDVGTCMQILYPDKKDRNFAMNKAGEIVDDASVREIIGAGSYDDMKNLRVRLELLCGAR
jgi:hypothetical protein